MILDWHKHYLNGVLPVTGGLLDQSAFYVDAMQTIDAAIASEQAQAAAEARARAGRSKGRAHR